jgi:hypothetical protein
MINRKAFATAAALAVLGGAVFIPADALARRGGGVGAAHGPVFGLPHAHIGAHRPFRPAFARGAHPLRGWSLHRFGARNRGADGVWSAGSTGYAPLYDPNDVTASVPMPGPFLAPRPLPYPPDHVGCLSRGYDVPAESGGVAKIVVTRC